MLKRSVLYGCTPLGLSLTLLVSCPLLVQAELDPGLTTPYKVSLVLKFAEHRLLTPTFKDQLQRELRDGLQAGLGAMGQVEVWDLGKVPLEKRSILWRMVTYRGLASLDGANQRISDTKTHFVFIDYVDGQYEIQARQFDGYTGQSSPVVRSERTNDRQFVARTAALLIDRDFGLVGTVIDARRADRVRVAFHGGGLKVPLDHWIRKDDILRLVRITPGGSSPRADRISWSLLQVEEAPGEDGTCWCRLYQPQSKPLHHEAGILGYRCLKLNTIRAPLRLRLVKARARVLTPEPNLEIHVRRNGFKSEEMDKVQDVTDAEGFFSTEKNNVLYDRLAFVTVLDAGVVRAQMPIAIVSDRTVVCPLNVSADPLIQLNISKNLWEQNLFEGHQLLDTLFKDLQELVHKSENRTRALEQAQQGLKGIEDLITHAKQERQRLCEAPQQLPQARSLKLTQGDQLLQDLQKRCTELVAFIANLDKILKDESDPKRKEILAHYEQGRLLENEAEFGKALEIYEKVLAGGIEDAKLQQHVTQLQAQWKVKNDKHRWARAFIYESWPPFQISTLAARVKKAQEALQVCGQEHDALAPQKLLKIAVAHLGKLRDRLETLQPDVREEDRKITEIIKQILEDLPKLIKDTTNYLKQSAPKR